MAKVQFKEQYGLFINGQWKAASDGETFITKSPSTGEVLAACAQATQADVDEAVEAAWAAYATWKNVPVKERAAVLNKIADIIDENAEYLATIESMDNGKPIRETSVVDVPFSAEHFRYFAGCILASVEILYLVAMPFLWWFESQLVLLVRSYRGTSHS